MKAIEELLSHRSEIDAELRKHKSPVTVMFTDLAGSTAFFERFGDTAGMTWIEEHYKVIFPFVQQYGGVVVKTIGDSVMAYFTDPAQAVACGVEIQKAMEGNNEGRDPKEQMHVRVALHHGLAYLRGVDVFGDVVNVAARIAKACLPAQLLVSEALYLSAQAAVTLPFKPVGAVQFHGKSGVEKLYEIVWTDEAAYQKLRELFPAKPQQTSYEDFSGGRYIIMNELGRGAMGVVYKAYDRHIGRMVALKTIPLEVDEKEKPELLARLKQESRAAGMLDHPNIVTVYDVGEEAGMFYFTMQYVEGKTLASVRAEKTLLPLDQVLDMMEQVLSAIGFAHQHGIIHRDIKPSNLMLTLHGALKVMDFGIAKFGDAGLTKAGVIVGTPSYLAPEQASGRRIDNRADIFALGSVFYELLTAEKAFPGESTTSIIFKILNDDPIPPRVIEPSLPPALDSIVQRALAKDPNQRFQTCEEMRTAIQECRKNPKATLAFPSAPTVRKTLLNATLALEPPPQKRKPMWLIAGGAAVLVLAVILGFLLLRGPSKPPASAAGATPDSAASRAVAPQATTPADPGTTASSEPAATLPSSASEPVSGPPSASDKSAINEGKTGKQAEGKRGRKEKTPPEMVKTNSKRKNGAPETAQAAAPSSPPADDDSAKPGASSLVSRDDIPLMLRRAEAYAGKGNLSMARYTYMEILKLDPQSAAAKDGLRRVNEGLGTPR